MEFHSTEGDFVALTVDNYQYPKIGGFGSHDLDANWLVVAGRVKSGNSEWTFCDPCLTTWEAHKLSSWLHSVADGTRQPAPIGPDSSGGEMLVFTEPCIAFSYQGRSSRGVCIRVYLSLEALPKWSASDDVFEHFVELVLSPDQLATAAECWDAQLRAFPPRP